MKAKIEDLFQSRNFELAQLVAISQEINLEELDIDFNTIKPDSVRPVFGERWTVPTLNSGIYLSICAGAVMYSTSLDGNWKTYEVAVMYDGRILNFEDLPFIEKLHHADCYINSGQIVYAYMKPEYILKLLNVINNGK